MGVCFVAGQELNAALAVRATRRGGWPVGLAANPCRRLQAGPGRFDFPQAQLGAGLFNFPRGKNAPPVSELSSIQMWPEFHVAIVVPVLPLPLLSAAERAESDQRCYSILRTCV